MRIFFQSSLQDLHRLVWRTIIHKDVFNVIKRLGEQRFSAPLNILKVGDTIIGGLGVSGGTGEEDHSLAEYGQSVLNEVL